MSVSCEDYYRQLHASCGVVLSASFQADDKGQHAVAHQWISDLLRWHDVLAHRPESGLILASLAEYQFALLALVLGQYRQAFMSLRLSLELLLGGVYYSANELHLRLWMNGQKDLVWSALISLDDGVFSKTFVGAFCEDLVDCARQYGAIAGGVYRECSEYVHGNAQTHSEQSGKVMFQDEAFQTWHSKAKSVRLLMPAQPGPVPNLGTCSCMV